MTSLYARALGPAFERLDPALQALHGRDGRWRGVAHLRQGGALARLAMRRVGYPDTEGPVPLTLVVRRDGEAEIWERDFDGRLVTSRQTLAGGGHIAEGLGPSTVLMRPAVGNGALSMTVVGARGGPVPLPALLSGGGRETAEGEAVRFDVEARARGLGLLIGYRGLLEPV